MRYPEFDGTQACAEVGWEFFYPENVSEAPGLYFKAREICRRCEWQEECGDYAIRHDSGYGMWGGLTPEERKDIRQRFGIINDPPKIMIPKAVFYEISDQ
jgi:hypothetical protein